MSKHEVPTTPRGRYNFRKSTKVLAEKITSFFGVRKRHSENQSQSVSKRRRSYSPNPKCFSSPVSAAPSPDRPPVEALHVRPRFSPLRFVDDSEEPSEFGVLRNFPPEMIFMFLERMSYSDLGSLSMTSKSWRERVQQYVKSTSLERRWVQELGEFEENADDLYTNQDPYFSLGLLIRRFNAIEGGFEARLNALRSVVGTAYSVLGTKSAAGCGRIINAFVRNESELLPSDYEAIISCVLSAFGDLKSSLHEALLPDNDKSRQLDSVFFSIKQAKKELVIRAELHGLFLSNGGSDPMSEPNRYFLSSLFQMYKPQCRTLLFLLYSPISNVACEEVIHWQCFSELIVDEQDEAKELLQPVATVLRALLVSRKLKKDYVWSKNCVFNLIEEVTTYPTPWSMNTFVSLQLFQPCLIPIAIAARMQKNYHQEVGDIICTMKTLLYRWNMDVAGYLSDAFDAMRASMARTERVAMYTSIVKFYGENLLEIQQNYDNEDNIQEIRIEFESMIALSPLLEKFID